MQLCQEIHVTGDITIAPLRRARAGIITCERELKDQATRLLSLVEEGFEIGDYEENLCRALIDSTAPELTDPHSCQRVGEVVIDDALQAEENYDDGTFFSIDLEVALEVRRLGRTLKRHAAALLILREEESRALQSLRRP